MSSEPVVYRSHVDVERLQGSLRRAMVPARDEPIYFGTNRELAEHYGRDPDAVEPHTTTLDYLVAAAAG